ncbi:MAG: phosphate signaling complex protein PhoU [Chthoniobacterales bacterium]|nr:phosphate signaling complex protein PhoU [Chthoniobacterales bacterium]
MPDNTPQHILARFDDALKTLRDHVLMMASLTDKLLVRAGEGLFQRNLDACNGVIADDAEIDVLEKNVDEDGMEIMVRFQPMARDLREVVAAMKVGTDLERVADQAVSIARRARRLNQSPSLPETAALEEMFRMALELFRASVRSFADRDETLARTLKPRDRDLDGLHHKMIGDLTARMSSDTARITQYLDLIFVARIIERIGDHATNIAEDAVFATSAVDIRHTTTPPAAG